MLEELHTKPMQINSRQNDRPRERHHQRVVPVSNHASSQLGQARKADLNHELGDRSDRKSAIRVSGSELVPVGADGVQQGGAGGREELGEDGGVEQEGEAQDSGADEERTPGEKTLLLVRVR